MDRVRVVELNRKPAGRRRSSKRRGAAVERMARLVSAQYRSERRADFGVGRRCEGREALPVKGEQPAAEAVNLPDSEADVLDVWSQTFPAFCAECRLTL